MLVVILLMTAHFTLLDAYNTYLCTVYSIENENGEEIVYSMHNRVTIVDINDTAVLSSGSLLMLISSDKYQFTKIYDSYAGGVRYISENYIIDIVDCTKKIQ